MAKFTRVFGIPKLPVHWTRGLRFRLTLSYVLFFTVLLVVIGLFFRRTIQSQLEGSVREALEEEWGEAKGYLKIEEYRPVWIADPTDPEEAYIVSRIKHVFYIADANGVAIDYDETYASIGLDSPAEIARILEGEPVVHIRYDKSGVPYLIKAGRIPDEHGKPYFFAIGRSLQPARQNARALSRRYFLAVPGMIALAALLGWILAGRAIRPVNSVSQAAREITGSNLSMQIPLRNAGDELDQLIDSFNRMTARLNQSFEQTRRFSTDVSHELRTPLTAIRGQLEVALFTAKTPEQYQEAMVNALEDVEKLSNIVRALLLLSQAESGQLALQKVALDLSEAAANIVEQFQIPAEEKGITLTADLAGDTMILADATQIERLISNLVSNAIKYTPSGGRVAVRVGPVGVSLMGANIDWVQLVIEDSGMGIPAENLPHIFDRFYRVRNASSATVTGLGLGLSFVSWIVDVHGGKIEVASTVGEGTRFTVLLPAIPAPLAEIDAEGAAESTLK